MQNEQVFNKVVVVTGASAGLGRAIAREFARHQARVGLLARGTEGLEAAKQEVDDLGRGGGHRHRDRISVERDFFR